MPDFSTRPSHVTRVRGLRRDYIVYRESDHAFPFEELETLELERTHC